ncbi:phospholipid carrier-dependent glycosyltransferase [Novosphingobium sp. B 225]|uniref:phospholipid carrier-dependent glycosyltransferase n=1 Tax=Novosphingobium sp. B 225 TaxID=1961849 RepID=UPI000B4B3B01|nr:phospholipid carrier-dependent glycosyltransferase [Novosphingobium sp. B 225]
MGARFTTEQDPADWCAVWAVFFLALVWWRLGIPSQIYFDEVHYVNAARRLNEGLRFNPEHPMLGKWVIAETIRLFGDRPLVWRVPSAIGGALGLFAFSRLVWFSTGSRRITFAALFLVATDFLWFVQSRIAMLDMVMALLGMIGLWLALSAVRLPQQARWRLALAGVSLGLALGAKWSIAPAAMVPGLVFAGWKLRDTGWRFLFARSGGPVPGMTLIEAALWLGLVPLCAYWFSFWPAFHWAQNPVNPWDPLGWHRYMLQLQDSVTRLHPYRSQWYQWVVNWRAIWYLYQPVDGVQRGVLLVGNPFTMLAGLPALGWCLWAGVRRANWAMLGFAGLYLISLLMWALSGKPIQFYYHYLLPGTFLMVCLALALDDLWQRKDKWRWLAPAALALSAAMFAYFYPILSAGPLCCGRPSYTQWMWLDSWR